MRQQLIICLKKSSFLRFFFYKTRANTQQVLPAQTSLDIPVHSRGQITGQKYFLLLKITSQKLLLKNNEIAVVVPSQKKVISNFVVTNTTNPFK